MRGKEQWAELLATLAGGPLEGSSRLVEMSFTLTYLSFVIGYLISPFAKQVQRLNEARWNRPGRIIERIWDTVTRDQASRDHKAWEQEVKNIKAEIERRKKYAAIEKRHADYLAWKASPEGPLPTDDAAAKVKSVGEYDWLRALNPGAGALSAKIRAEFTMYNGLAVAMVPVGAIAIASHAWVLAVVAFSSAPVLAFRGLT